MGQFCHFKRSNPTLINTEHAKYKEKFSQVNSPTKGAEELKFVTTVVHGSLQEKGYANLKYHLIWSLREFFLILLHIHSQVEFENVEIDLNRPKFTKIFSKFYEKQFSPNFYKKKYLHKKKKSIWVNSVI